MTVLVRFSTMQAPTESYRLASNGTLKVQVVTNWSQGLKMQANLSKRHFQKK
jgi:hypothetical protein